MIRRGDVMLSKISSFTETEEKDFFAFHCRYDMH